MSVVHPCTGLTSLPVVPRDPSLNHSLWAAGLQEQSCVGLLGCRSRAVWASWVGTEPAPRPLPCPPTPRLSLPASVGCPVLSLRPGHGGQQVRLEWGWTADLVSGSSAASPLIVGVGTERQPQAFPLPTKRLEFGPPPRFSFQRRLKKKKNSLILPKCRLRRVKMESFICLCPPLSPPHLPLRWSKE